MSKIKELISNNKNKFIFIALAIVCLVGVTLVGTILLINQGNSTNANDENTDICTDTNCPDCITTTQREEAGTNENGDPVVPLREDTNQETYTGSSQSTPTASNTSNNGASKSSVSSGSGSNSVNQVVATTKAQTTAPTPQTKMVWVPEYKQKAIYVCGHCKQEFSSVSAWRSHSQEKAMAGDTSHGNYYIEYENVEVGGKWVSEPV